MMIKVRGAARTTEDIFRGVNSVMYICTRRDLPLSCTVLEQ